MVDPLSVMLPLRLPVRRCLRNGRGPCFGELEVESVLVNPCNEEAPEASGLR